MNLSMILGVTFGILSMSILIVLLLLYLRKRNKQMVSPRTSEKHIYPYDLKIDRGSVTPRVRSRQDEDYPTESEENTSQMSHNSNRAEERAPTTGNPLPLSGTNDTTNLNPPFATGTESTSRQFQLRAEVNQFRSQLLALQQALAVSSEENRQMTAYIHALEAQLDSDWARGLTDEPPPLYHEVVSILSRS
ncbi:hypothetical protein VKT23_016878 [Stygiomarasmius scandens]|uniref:Uncharacterized protein n=1 Tax=Marasmiellus scandens TaxID=2682957 RepID=A0ABR1IY15_9AGAR